MNKTVRNYKPTPRDWLRYVDDDLLAARYPDAFPGSLPGGLPNKEEASIALKSAQKIVEFVKKELE